MESNGQTKKKVKDKFRWNATDVLKNAKDKLRRKVMDIHILVRKAKFTCKSMDIPT